MIRPILLTLGLLFFTTQTLAWTLSADFEDGTVGSKAESPNPNSFHSVAGNSKYSNSTVLSGEQSASVYIEKGYTGFGYWGGGFTFPTQLKEGDSIWFRINVFFPDGYDFSCGGCTQGMKFMRIHTRSSSGSNEGYLDTLIKSDDGVTGGTITVDHEVHQSVFWDNINGYPYNKGTPVIRGKWHTYEMNIKFSSIHGQGAYRIWQDGNLIFEELKTATLKSSTSQSDSIYIYTYWNNGAPRTQTSYIDDIVITSEIPSKKDANGNPYIGVGPSEYKAPPKTGGQWKGWISNVSN